MPYLHLIYFQFKDIKKLAYEFSMMEMQAIHGRLHELGAYIFYYTL